MPRPLSRSVAALTAVLLLGACVDLERPVTPYEQPVAPGFEAMLSEGYAAIAEAMGDQDDSGDAEHLMATRARLAAAGDGLPPLNSQARILTVDQRSVLDPARVELTQALVHGARAVVPELAAEAQATYDCWVLETEGGRGDGPLATDCIRRFDLAMALMSDDPAMRLQTEYVVFFATGSATVGPDQRGTIDAAAAAATEDQDALILLIGHADTVADTRFNQRLSERRAEAVRQELVGNGLPAERIQVRALGETELPVPTGDEVANAQNRVVIIRLQ